jgi:hypothetical protein
MIRTMSETTTMPMSDREVGSPVGQCPLLKCAITVYVREVKEPHDAIAKANVTAEGAGTKDTDQLGFADFKGLAVKDDPWVVKVDLKRLARDYAWGDEDDPVSRQSKTIPGGIDKFYLFEVMRRCWPIIEVMWWDEKEGKPDPSKKISGVGVVIEGPYTDPTETDLGKTAANGRVLWKRSETGKRRGPYQVHFTFDGTEAAKYCEVVESKQINVDAGCNFTTPPEVVFPFSVRKFWYSFTVKDNFDQPVGGLDYRLTFPGSSGEQPKKGKLPETGKVSDPGPKGAYKFAVKLLSDAKWTSPTPLEIGKEAQLGFKATGFDPNTEITVQIFDACVLTGDALDTITPKPKTPADGGELTAKWTPDAGKLKSVKSGAVVFVAKAAEALGQVLVSPPAVVVDKQKFEVKDGQGNGVGGAKLLLAYEDDYKLADPLDLTCDGQGNGELLVPIGRRLVSVALPGKAGARGSFKSEEESEKREFLVT